MVLVLGGLRRRIALALLGHDVNQDRPVLGVADVLEHGQQVVEIVPVDRSDVIKSKLLEQRAAHDEAARHFLGEGCLLIEEFRQPPGDALADLSQRPIGAAGHQPGQIGRHCADRGRDRHVVVVEDDDEARIHGAGIVHCLVGHPAGHRAVTDHADDVVRFLPEIARNGHSEARRDRSRGVSGAERVVFALGALGETR